MRRLADGAPESTQDAHPREVLPAELSRSDISDLQRGDYLCAYDRLVRWMFDRGADRDGLTILGHS